MNVRHAIAKFLRTLILKNICKRLLLVKASRIVLSFQVDFQLIFKLL